MKIINAGDRIMNTYIYPVKDGYVMIDTGYERSYYNVKRKMKKYGIDFPQIKYIFLTHAHDDHAGFLRKVLEEHPHIKVIADRKALPVLRRGQNSFEGGCSGKTAFLFCRILAFLGKGKHLFPAVDEKFSDRFITVSRGNTAEAEKLLEGKILFTPGHTADSVSLKKGGLIFCGDAAMNGFPSSEHITIWIENKTDFKLSWNVILSQKAKLILPAHGKPFPPDELEKYKPEIAKRRLYKLSPQ